MLLYTFDMLLINL